MQLSKAKLQDFEVFYQIRCEDTNIRWTGHNAAPDENGFRKWFTNMLDNPRRDIFLCWKDGVCIGYLYIDSISDKEVEIAYGISECNQGKGYASVMISKCLDDIVRNFGGVEKVIANISEKNIASQRVVMKNGFKKTGEFYFANLPLLGGESKFVRWEVIL